MVDIVNVFLRSRADILASLGFLSVFQALRFVVTNGPCDLTSAATAERSPRAVNPHRGVIDNGVAALALDEVNLVGLTRLRKRLNDLGRSGVLKRLRKQVGGQFAVLAQLGGQFVDVGLELLQFIVPDLACEREFVVGGLREKQTIDVDVFSHGTLKL